MSAQEKRKVQEEINRLVAELKDWVIIDPEEASTIKWLKPHYEAPPNVTSKAGHLTSLLINQHPNPVAYQVRTTPKETEIPLPMGKSTPSFVAKNEEQYRDLVSSVCKARKRRNTICVFRGQPYEWRLSFHNVVSLLSPGERSNVVYGKNRIVMSKHVVNGQGIAWMPKANSNLWNLVSFHTQNRREPKRYGDVSYKHFYFPALLQHYGYPSYFLDVTTDPFVALWFSKHNTYTLYERGRYRVVEYRPIRTSFGVVYILELPSVHLGRFWDINRNLWTIDLSEAIENRTWRPWRQSAYSVSQSIWGVRLGVDYNVYANQIIGRILIADWAFHSLQRKGLIDRHLFPDSRTDRLYAYALRRPLTEWEAMPRIKYQYSKRSGTGA